MILHLLFDSQFADYVIEQFEAEEMQSDFVLVTSTQDMKHFKRIDAVRIVNPIILSEMELLLQDISQYNSVIFHGLFYSWQEWLLNQWPKNVKMAWVCWGGEIYGQPDIRTTFLKPLSRCVNRLHRMRRPDEWEDDLFPRDLFRRANYCLTNVEAEYECAKQYLGTDIQHLPYNYYSIDETLGSLKDARCIGKNIFLGNSATIENNHLETLLRLKRVGIGDKKIIIPLSYGSPWVRNMCKKVGQLLFGKRFCPLLNFMPREEYNATMLDCAVMIQAHLREQAHGNIVTGLWLGMRVYLSEKGIDYQHFKSLGVHVFSIERNLTRDNQNALSPLTEEEIAYNRQVLLKAYGKEGIQFDLLKIVRVLA